MIQKLEDYLIGIAIGIRYRANFAIEDNMGQIVDKILYSHGSYFNEHFFPLVYNDVGAKVFHNKESGNSLRINNSNVILEVNYPIDSKSKNVDEIIESFNDEIIVGVLKEFKITQFNRAGYIHRYLFNVKELATEFIKKTIGDSFDGVNDVNLRFSKKFPVPDSLIKKEVFDYHNAIFNIIKKSDRDEIFMSLDYQKYFDPPLPSTTQIQFREFVKQVNRFNSKNYLDWVNNNFSELK